MGDVETFAREQRRLAHVWTLLGLAGDLKNDGDWFTASLATREIFVQRFGERIRAFENVCPHRFHPVRTEDKGNGPVVCGFHHWQFNSEGLAVGVPLCRELFGALPHELGAKLAAVEIEICGQLIFGRFPSASHAESLAAYLGEGFEIIASLADPQSKPRTISEEVSSNWRLLFHISLDDYHGVAVHPTTFGRAGYLKRKDVRYFRFGDHSAFFTPAEELAFAQMRGECIDGSFRPSCYSIFQLFPNLVVVLLRADKNYWFCIIQQHVPIAYNRTKVRNWVFPAPFPDESDWRPRWLRPLPDRIRMEVFLQYFRRVLNEDQRTCERIQAGATRIDRPSILGAFEERIAWFESAYRKLAGIE